MLDIDSLAVDPTASEEGTWATFMGAKFLIARSNNSKATQLRAKMALDNWDELTAGDEKAEVLSREIDTRVMADAVLLDWENVTKGGKPVKYKPDVGYTYLIDPRFRDLLEFVQRYSFNRANYQEQAESEITDSVKDSAAS